MVKSVSSFVMFRCTAAILVILFVCLNLIKMEMGLVNFLKPIILILNLHLRNQHFLKSTGICCTGIYPKMVYILIGLPVVAGRVLWIWVCLFFFPTVCPSVNPSAFRAFRLSACFCGIGPLVFYKVQHVRGSCGVVHEKLILSKNNPKMVFWGFFVVLCH